MQGEGATHDKIYIVLYTIFTDKVSLSYTVPLNILPAFKCLRNKNESLTQEVFMSF